MRTQRRRQIAIVGKGHHCMVDGLAAVELASLLLDPTPEPAACEPEAGGRGAGAGRRAATGAWAARSARSAARHAARAAAWTSPRPRQLRDRRRGRVAGDARAGPLAAAAPASVLNGQLSPLRRLAWTQRPLSDLRPSSGAYGTTVNDVMLAAVAGAHARVSDPPRASSPLALKAMVPVSVRSADDVLGNHISFVFAELPCDEPDPLDRLLSACTTTMSQRKRDGEPEGADLVLKAAALTPSAVQQRCSRLIASPRTFNLVVSNIPGPDRADVHARLPAARPPTRSCRWPTVTRSRSA